jgi:hypothetical protein
MASGHDLYSVRFVHKIAPKDSDKLENLVAIPGNAWADRKALGKVLRQLGILCKGVSVRTFRHDEKVVERIIVSPSHHWHSIILTFEGHDDE